MIFWLNGRNYGNTDFKKLWILLHSRLWLENHSGKGIRRLLRILFKISGAAKVGSPNFAGEDSEPCPRFLIVITS